MDCCIWAVMALAVFGLMMIRLAMILGRAHRRVFGDKEEWDG